MRLSFLADACTTHRATPALVQTTANIQMLKVPFTTDASAAELFRRGIGHRTRELMDSIGRPADDHRADGGAPSAASWSRRDHAQRAPDCRWLWRATR